MNRIKPDSILQTICSLLIFLFVYTALSKLFEFETFQRVLSRSPLIGDYNKVIARSIPAVEIATSVLLLFRYSRRVGLYMSLGLMITFTIYIGYMLVFAAHLPCACGGVIQRMGWTGHFLFNLLVTLLCAYSIFLEKRISTTGFKISEPLLS